MKKGLCKCCLYLVVTLCIPALQVFAQVDSQAAIINVDFTLQQGKIVISYDFPRSARGETYVVGVVAITESGDTIRPGSGSLTGDVHENIIGGKEKSITWDFERDNFYTSEAFQFQVFANLQFPETTRTGDYPGLATAMIMSTAFPGWGSTRLTNGKPHWIKGILGYGCIAMSYVYNSKAVTTYDDYLLSMDSNTRNSLYDDASSQKLFSTIFAASAIAVWVFDYTCVIISHNKLKKNTYNSQIPKISVGYSIDPVLTQPLLTVKLNF